MGGANPGFRVKRHLENQSRNDSATLPRLISFKFTRNPNRFLSLTTSAPSRRLALLAVWFIATAAFAQTALYYSFPLTTTTNWVSVSVPLLEAAGWAVGSPDGPAPTQAQFQDVLGSVDALTIQFDGTNPVVNLDNISLAGLVTSTFGTTNFCIDDGWTCREGLGAECLFGNPPPSLYGPTTWGGYTTTFGAAPQFLGNDSAAYGGSLTFDVSTGSPAWSNVTNCIVMLFKAAPPSATGPFMPFEWGNYDFGMGLVPPGVTNIAQISVGFSSVVALRNNGTPVAWPTTVQTNVPVGLTNLIAVAAGSGYNLALKRDGTVIEWQTTGTGWAVPAGLSNVVAITACYERGFALKSDGTVVGWGYGFSPPSTNRPLPSLTNIASVVVQTFPSSPVNLALTRDGNVLEFIPYTPVDGGDTTVSFVTDLPAGLTNVTAIAAGGRHFLALKADGTAVAWGLNVAGETNVPPGLTDIVAIGAGPSISMAVRRDGTVVAWGDNTYYETNIPPGLTNVIQVGASLYKCIALIGAGPPVQSASVISPRWHNGRFSVSVPTENGRVYSLEYKDSLQDANWSGLPLVAGTGGLVVLSDPTAPLKQRFYRVQRW